MRIPFLALLVLAPILHAESQLELTPLIHGVTQPTQVVAAHDGTHNLYVAELVGRIRVFDGEQLLAAPFLDLSSLVNCCNNGGLLSIVFHPHYATNGQLFVLYVNHDQDTVVARYTAHDGVADPTSAQILFVVDQPLDDIPNHHGGTLQFGPDGFLYISIGDGGANHGATTRAQDKSTFLGKLLRIDVDHGTPYAVPPDNPFVGTAGVAPEIYAYGLRNPWRFSFDRWTGELYIGDVGQSAYEEIDILNLAQARGANFGWPMTEGLHCFPFGSQCTTTGVTLPVFDYNRSYGCSATGGYRYRGTQSAGFAGAYFYADWCSGRIWAARENTSGAWTTKELTRTGYAIVSFGEDDDGELYVVDFNGGIYRLGANVPRRRTVRH